MICLLLLLAPNSHAQDPLERLIGAVPRNVSDCRAEQVRSLIESADQLELWTTEQSWRGRRPNPNEILRVIETIVTTKSGVDVSLDELLELRTKFVDMPEGEARREAIRNYLKATSQLIELSGRLRYTMRDVIDGAAFDLDPHPEDFKRLIDLLAKYKVTIGAAVMSYVLFDPQPNSELYPYPNDVRAKVLQLIGHTRQINSLQDLVRFMKQSSATPALKVSAAEMIRHIGLPQDPHPDQDPTLPKPSITAAELRRVLNQIDAAQLHPKMVKRRDELVEWLSERVEKGVTGDEYRVGTFTVKTGDWLLMRNPSPYNLFTDLSPGLFTHVGVVATQTARDGKRRFVLVDLPERGATIPVTNVETYLLRTLHYAFVRHQDAKVQMSMGRAAADMIGNETQFDLTFRTDRVLEFKGKSLKGQLINTYCAGFLLLCAQQTSHPRSEFFPISEYAAGGNCRKNLGKLGLSVGNDFVSPTGAIFSPHLEIVGRREPMYTPDREIKERIYDHFAESMVNKELHQSPDTYQALRQKLAQLSKINPFLAKALAKANNVSEHMDLESAAKAATVIETLDEIADGNMRDFFAARRALLAGPLDTLEQRGFDAKQIDRVRRFRSTHQNLFQQMSERQLTPRDLRIALVTYYANRGITQLDERFFAKQS